MNLNSIRFKFTAFNVVIVLLLFILMALTVSLFVRRFLIEERTESRKIVNDQTAFVATAIVMGSGGGDRDLFHVFLSKYPDLVYSVVISQASSLDFYAEQKDRLWFIKNEELARKHEDLFTQRPQKTEVNEKEGMLNIISPVYAPSEEGDEKIVGYILCGYSLRPLIDKLKSVNWIILLSTFTMMLVTTLAAYILVLLITKPLNNAVAVINNVANGDFTREVSIKSKSEIGVLINTINEMISKWKSSIEKLKGVIDHTNKSAENLSDAIKQQENVTAEQASAVNEITTTVDELNSSSKQVYEKAEQVSQSSHNVLKIASDGEKAIKESIEEINIIRNRVKSISEHTLNLSIEAQQIGSIVKTVSDIANKTDMLAINAGIEAARAGEHGRGFSIVATEVRELADQSRKSAEKIAQLIENIQAATNTTVLATDEAINGFQVGIKLILEAGHTIDNLVKHVQETVNYASEIALASRQQSLGTEQVATVMSSINEAMRGTAQSASKILGEATVLKKLSDDLSSVANIYRI